jgi:hypothetical protein
MTGYQSKKAAASAKTIDEVNWADHEPDGLVHTAQEPVAFFNPHDNKFYWAKPTKITAPITIYVEPMPLYTAPPQRTWVGLTIEDCYEFAKAQLSWDELLIAAETKLKEKNT